MNFIVRLVGIFLIVVVVMHLICAIFPDLGTIDKGMYILFGMISVFFAVAEGD